MMSRHHVQNASGEAWSGTVKRWVVISSVIGSHVGPLEALHKFCDADGQRVRKDLESSQSHALLSAFQSVKVDAVDSGHLCQLILSNALFNRI